MENDPDNVFIGLSFPLRYPQGWLDGIGSGVFFPLKVSIITPPMTNGNRQVMIQRIQSKMRISLWLEGNTSPAGSLDGLLGNP